MDVPMEWSLREDGSYKGRFVAPDSGVYMLSASVAPRPGDTTHSISTALLADDQGADVEQAELRTSLLKARFE